MSNLQPVAPQQPSPIIESSPVTKRTAEISASLIGGALSGYIVYWITRLLDKFGAFGAAGGSAITPLPYVLVGLASAAIIEGARLTSDVALSVLGDRNKYEKLNSKKASAADRLRQRSWKVISGLEKIPQKADEVFSRTLQIRTTREIQQKNIPDRELHFMEIARRAFWEQVHETAIAALPQELGVCAVEACGYTVLGGHLFIWLHAFNFVFGMTPPNPFSKDPLPPNSGLINRIGRVYKQMELDEKAEQHLKESENKMYCDILSAMYPAEFDKLDAREANDQPQDPSTQHQDELDIEDTIIKNEPMFMRPTPEFDPVEFQDDLAFRHTVFQSGNILGLPVRENDKHGKPITPDKDPIQAPFPVNQQQRNFLRNLVLVK